jgi:hypothetical protein
MIIRAAALGFAFWLLATMVLRFYGDRFFYLSDTHFLIMCAAAIVTMPVLTTLSLKLIRVARGDEAEGAIALAFPGMFLNTYVTFDFGNIFPNLHPLLSDRFGALMLLSYGVIIFTGLMLTRLAPEDERL